jgi:hypothetical protein
MHDWIDQQQLAQMFFFFLLFVIFFLLLYMIQTGLSLILSRSTGTMWNIHGNIVKHRTVWESESSRAQNILLWVHKVHTFESKSKRERERERERLRDNKMYAWECGAIEWKMEYEWKRRLLSCFIRALCSRLCVYGIRWLWMNNSPEIRSSLSPFSCWKFLALSILILRAEKSEDFFFS